MSVYNITWRRRAYSNITWWMLIPCLRPEKFVQADPILIARENHDYCRCILPPVCKRIRKYIVLKYWNQLLLKKNEFTCSLKMIIILFGSTWIIFFFSPTVLLYLVLSFMLKESSTFNIYTILHFLVVYLLKSKYFTLGKLIFIGLSWCYMTLQLYSRIAKVLVVTFAYHVLYFPLRNSDIPRVYVRACVCVLI